jgi:hypothetical protein
MIIEIQLPSKISGNVQRFCFVPSGSTQWYSIPRPSSAEKKKRKQITATSGTWVK